MKQKNQTSKLTQQKNQWQLIISVLVVEQTRSEKLVGVYILYPCLCVPKKLYNSLLYPGRFFHLAVKYHKGSRGAESLVGLCCRNGGLP